MRQYWNSNGVNHNGYLELHCPNHPFANANGRVKIHRLVFEKHHNCILLPWATIHHKNGIKTDNRIGNLERVNGREHNRNHMKEIVKSKIRNEKGIFIAQPILGLL